jgi:Fe-S-cluster-containing hydrogenase component 2
MHDGVSNPARSRIKIMKWESEGIYVPVTCQQCEDAPCMNVCPVKAISRDEETGAVMVDYNICIGCRSCVAVCPFGAMNYNVIEKKVFKCDLCGGDPQCARFCDVNAISYVDADKESVFKKKDAAERIYKAQNDAQALQAAI